MTNENTDKPSVASSAAEQTPAAAPKRRKKRWWLRILLAIVILLIALAALAPTLISTAAGQRMLVGAINGNIRGTIRIQDLSLGWFDPCWIAGVEVDDPQNRKVLAIELITWDRGLWHAIWAGRDLGQWTVDNPATDLYFNAAWTPSLQEAFESRVPSPPAAATPSKPAKPSEPMRVAMAIKNARLHMFRPDRREFALTDVTANLNVQTLQDISADLTAILTGGGKLTCSATVKNYNADPANPLASAIGDIRVQTNPPIDLATLLDFATESDATGKLVMDVHATLSGEQSAGSCSIQVTGLSAGAKGQQQTLTPTDIRLNSDLTYKAGTYNSTMKLVSTLGDLSAKLQYNATKSVEPLTRQKVMDSLAKGNSPPLPEFSLDASGKVNLAAAGQSVPALMQLRKDVRISEGSLDIPSLQAHGGASPSARMNATLHMTTVRDGQQNVWQPIEAGLAIDSDPGGRVKIENISLTSSFAAMKASGTMDELDGSFQADLNRLREELSPVFDLEKVVMGGNLSGAIKVDKPRDNPQRTQWAATLHAQNAIYGAVPDTPPAGQDAPKPPKAVTCDVEWTGAVDRKADRTALSGKLAIPRLAVSDTGEIFIGDGPTIRHDLVYLPGPRRIDLTSLAAESKLFTLSLQGNVRNLDSDLLLDFKGAYSLSWQEMTTLAKRLSPEAAQTLAMLGSSQGDIRITGPASRPQIVPTFRGIEGGTAVGWGDGSKVYGLTFGQAQFTPALADAHIKLPVASVSANGGTMRLGFTTDLSGPEPVLSIPGKLVVLENVALNEEVGRELLSRAMPLFAKLNSLEGTVSLRVQDIQVPLGESIKKTGQGSGQLDLSNLRLRPAGEFAELLSLLGLPSDKPYPVKTSPLNFVLRNGGIEYKDFTLTFADALDLKFSGDVKFDNTVNLVVSVPVSQPLLDKLGVKGLPPTYADTLKNLRIDIPLAGSRGMPKLDLNRVNTQSLVDQVIHKTTLSPEGLMQDILKATSKPAAPPPASRPAKPKPR